MGRGNATRGEGRPQLDAAITYAFFNQTPQ